MSLGEQEPENETDNFRSCSIGVTRINWMMKYDRRVEITYKYIKNEYNLCFKMLTITCFVDPTSGFKHM